MFAELSFARPDEGEPRIGYAISAALLGDEQRAITVMRTALEIEPESLASVPIDAPLLDLYRVLLDRYTERARDAGRDPDGLLMAAVLRYLLGDTAAAFFASDAAIRSGDESIGAANLKSFSPAWQWYRTARS